MDALLDLIGDKMAIPQSIRNSLEEREMLKQELAEQAQMMAQENPELAEEVATQAVRGGM
jgi:RNA-binding protein YhbY